MEIRWMRIVIELTAFYREWWGDLASELKKRSLELEAFRENYAMTQTR